MKSKFLLLFFLILIVFGTIFFQNKKEEGIVISEKNNVLTQKNEENEENYINFGNIKTKVEILKTTTDRIKGLSQRKELEKDTVVLFVFEKPGFYGFWMKEMLFPIDIAWLDENKKIIHIEKNVSPQTYPKIFYPNQEALYVIETNAHFFDLNQIKIGDSVKFVFRES